MKTLIINGSPKGTSEKCNSNIFAHAFIKNMENPCEIKCIAEESYKELAEYVQAFDAVIIILPLYIHAMPGIVMKFIEELSPVSSEDKYIGFFVQAGFIETAQHKYLVRYLESLSKRLKYNYLGTVCKGEAAGVYMVPRMFKKVLKLVSDLGECYEKTYGFDQEIVDKLAQPYEISKFKLKILKLMKTLGVDKIMWHRMLKKNNAYEKRLEQPFI